LVFFACSLCGLACRTGLSKYQASMVEKRSPGGRWLEPLAAPLQEPHAQFIFQLSDLSA